LDEDEVGNRDLMLWINVACERGEGPVGHTYSQGRRVFE